MQYSRPYLAALLASLLLSACGFQLRGVTELPPVLNPVYVQAPQGSRIGHALIRALNTREVPVTRNPGEAGLHIRILEELDSERVAAVNSQGKVIGTELQYRVRFDALGRDGAARVPSQRIVLARDYVNPEIEVIGKAEEAQLIRKDMVQDMADRILHRIKAQLSHSD